MEHLTVINCILGFVGIMIAFLLRLQAAMKKPDSGPFMLSKWITENWIDLFLGVVGTFLGIFFMEEITGFVNIEIGEGSGEHVHSLMFGLAGQLIISKLKSIAPLK